MISERLLKKHQHPGVSLLEDPTLNVHRVFNDSAQGNRLCPVPGAKPVSSALEVPWCLGISLTKPHRVTEIRRKPWLNTATGGN